MRLRSIFCFLGLEVAFCCAAAVQGLAAESQTAGVGALQDPSALCAAAIGIAAKRYAIPPGLLDSIAKVESGRPITSMSDVRAWPWTINADGTGMFFNSKAEAIAWSQQAGPQGVRFLDVGCMQVNLRMHPRAFVSLDHAFDPVANVDYAARYLRELLVEANGDWNIAVGLYHSHTPHLAADYRYRVAEVGAGIITGFGGPEPLYRRAMRRGTLRLALTGGGVLLVNTARQPTGRRPQRRSQCEVAAILAPLLRAAPKVAGCKS